MPCINKTSLGALLPPTSFKNVNIFWLPIKDWTYYNRIVSC